MKAIDWLIEMVVVMIDWLNDLSLKSSPARRGVILVMDLNLIG